MEKSREGTYYAQGSPVPETPSSGAGPAPWKKTRVVGTPRPRVDAYERVSGAALYPSDIVLPDMLYGAILRCPHPHALVKRVDAEEALRMPGVRAVVTGSSPEAKLAWPYSQEVSTLLFDPHCRFEGEAVGAVAAETPYQAWDAVRAIRVEYEILPFVVDERRSMEASAPRVHESGNRVKRESYERGNVERGFAEADVVLEQAYRSECELHTPMELHGCVAR